MFNRTNPESKKAGSKVVGMVVLRAAAQLFPVETTVPKGFRRCTRRRVRSANPATQRLWQHAFLPASFKKFALAKNHFAMQSQSMNPNWAEENLQTIRTLMERSALYRRALAPIMLFAGTLGTLAAALGLFFGLKSTTSFGLLWLATASVALVGSFLIARRQALKENEQIWSPPTRRVVMALSPPLLAGFCLGSWPAFHAEAWPVLNLPSALVWIIFYGCALHSAGFFMPRGIRLFGWCFIISACLLFLLFLADKLHDNFLPHLIMGIFFGGLHLAYGIYLYFTEQKTPIA